MKPFDLEKALAGEPVKLRDGRKAYVLADTRDLFSYNLSYRCLVGVCSTVDNNNAYSGKMTWRYNGEYYNRLGESDYDIVGMWEEQKLSTEEIMEKAFREDLILKHSLLQPEYRGFRVVGKTLDNDYILQDCDNGNMYFAYVFNENIVWSIKD